MALLRVPTAAELTRWDFPFEAGSAPFRSAADALEIIAKTCASDYGVSEPGDDDESYQRLLDGARDCGRHMSLSDPVQREQVGKVALAALLAAAWALTIAELNESMAIVNAAWEVVDDIWLGDDPVPSLEGLRASSRLEWHCGHLQRRITAMRTPCIPASHRSSGTCPPLTSKTSSPWSPRTASWQRPW